MIVPVASYGESQVEFFLRKLSHQQAKPVKLQRRDETSKQPIKVFGVQHFALRDIAEAGMCGQNDRRGEFRKKALGNCSIAKTTSSPHPP